jgi:hypothetical protein
MGTVLLLLLLSLEVGLLLGYTKAKSLIMGQD